jgi:hypothetical protein
VYKKNTPESVLDEAFLCFNFTQALENLQAHLIQLVVPELNVNMHTFFNAMKCIAYMLGDN